MRRARLTRIVPVLGVVGALGLTGCVSQEEYDKLWETNRSLLNRNQELMNDLESSQSQYGALAGAGTSAQQTIAALQGENGRLRTQLTDASRTLMGLEDRLASLEVGRLDPATDLALSRLAAQYPNLIVYDSDRGMLRFASDLTFRSGSDEVQSPAMESIGALATILQTPEAGEYDVKIVGHTDSEQVSSRTARLHPTNVHLSAHRAISVRTALGNSGVAQDRMYAAGWGQYRPSIANTSTGNTPANRRVEIFLVPSTRDLYAAADAVSTEDPAPRSVDADEEVTPRRMFDPTK
ncbi:MAG: hypothetical protein DHS20C14_13040 [Phycisphaeraceae bacterium]|nr:MAG: hypothetical protein DHS20C14_13040 [Phycisphaeraceae bacterium]